MNIGEIVREVEALPVEQPESIPPREPSAPAESPALEPAEPAAP
jgi:hypothetical protein